MTSRRFHVPDKVLGALIILAWVSLFFADTVAQRVRDMIDREPWFHVRLEVDGQTINYFRDINRWLHGRWTAVLQQRNDLWPGGWEGICDASGEFTYKPLRAGTVRMSYEYFFDNECSQPITPHRVCVSYTLTDLTNKTRPFGPYCSAEVTPS